MKGLWSVVELLKPENMMKRNLPGLVSITDSNKLNVIIFKYRKLEGFSL